MKNPELIADFLNKVVSGDTEAAKAAFSLYCNSKAKDITIRESVIQKANVTLFDTILKEFKSQDMQKVLDIQADNILVNGKPVGRVSTTFNTDANGITDIENDQSGINFTSIEGDFSKEFADIDALFAWLRQRYLGEK